MISTPHPPILLEATSKISLSKMKYGNCFLKPRLALFIMKWNLLWFPFYLNTDSFFFLPHCWWCCYCGRDGKWEKRRHQWTLPYSVLLATSIHVCNDILALHWTIFINIKVLKHWKIVSATHSLKESRYIYIYIS